MGIPTRSASVCGAAWCGGREPCFADAFIEPVARHRFRFSGLWSMVRLGAVASIPVRTESELFDLQGCGLWRSLARRPVSDILVQYMFKLSVSIHFKQSVVTCRVSTRTASVCGAVWCGSR